MRAYRINVGKATRFAGSHGAATSTKRAMMEEAGLNANARSGFQLVEVDIPTGKVDLIDFLNSFAEETEKLFVSDKTEEVEE